MIYLLIAVLIAVLAVVFALQNAVPITVSFLIWKADSSLAFILIIAFSAGLVVSLLFNTLSRFKRIRLTSSQKKDAKETQNDITDKNKYESE